MHMTGGTLKTRNSNKSIRGSQNPVEAKSQKKSEKTERSPYDRDMSSSKATQLGESVALLTTGSWIF